MHILVGLGNPGSRYANTRHNVGFMAVDHFHDQYYATLSWTERYQSLYAQSERIVLCKPQTYMNASGVAVRSVLRAVSYGLVAKQDFSHLIVIHDDLDLPVGTYKLEFGHRPKTHNGLDSIRDALGSDQFWYARIGVDGRKGDRSVSGQDYVLGVPSPDERAKLKMSITALVDQLYAKTS